MKGISVDKENNPYKKPELATFQEVRACVRGVKQIPQLGK